MLWLSSKVRTALTACISLAGARGIPKTVYFKSGREAFDLHCKYGKIYPLRNGCIRLGLIVPGALTADSEGYQSVVVKIADPVTPFLCRGTTAVPNMPPLQGDQLDDRFHESCHKRGIHLSFQTPICAVRGALSERIGLKWQRGGERLHCRSKMRMWRD